MADTSIPSGSSTNNLSFDSLTSTPRSAICCGGTVKELSNPILPLFD